MRISRISTLVFALALGAGVARAQVVRPPNIQGPINAAKAAAAKTNEQTRTAESVGGATQQKSAPAQQQKAAPAPASKAPQKADAKAPQKADSKTAANQKGGAKAPGAKADTGSGAVSQTGSRRNQV